MMTAHHRLWFWTRSRSPVVFFPNTGVWILELWWPLIILSDLEAKFRSYVVFFPNTGVCILELWWPLIIGIDFEPESRSPVVFFPNTGVRILELWWPLIICCDFEPESRSPVIFYPNTGVRNLEKWWPLIIRCDFPILAYPFYNFDDRSSSLNIFCRLHRSIQKLLMGSNSGRLLYGLAGYLVASYVPLLYWGWSFCIQADMGAGWRAGQLPYPQWWWLTHSHAKPAWFRGMEDGCQSYSHCRNTRRKKSHRRPSEDSQNLQRNPYVLDDADVQEYRWWSPPKRMSGELFCHYIVSSQSHSTHFAT